MSIVELADDFLDTILGHDSIDSFEIHGYLTENNWLDFPSLSLFLPKFEQKCVFRDEQVFREIHVINTRCFENICWGDIQNLKKGFYFTDITQNVQRSVGTAYYRDMQITVEAGHITLLF